MKASKPVRYLFQTALALVYCLAAGMSAHGQEQIPGYPDDVRFGFDPRELALLPPYCIYTQLFRDNVPGGNNFDQINRWRLLLGPAFNDLHHYCWGLMKTNRALLLARTQRLRTFYLRDSIPEFDYLINRHPDFKLLPEILTKKGENLVRLGKGQDGMVEFQRAIAFKPDYWPPYAAMSDYYKQIGDLAKARKSVEEGLSFNPGVKALERRMAELNGTKGRREGAQQPQSSIEKSAAQPQTPAEQSNERSN